MKLPSLYETDETAWLDTMSDLIKKRRYKDIDFPHLQEYLQDMAKRDRREVFSRLRIMLVHILKWQYQPRRRSRSWKATISSQRFELQDIVESQSLKHHAEEVLEQAYRRAVIQAADETGLKEKTFPATCPFALTDILTFKTNG